MEIATLRNLREILSGLGLVMHGRKQMVRVQKKKYTDFVYSIFCNCLRKRFVTRLCSPLVALDLPAIRLFPINSLKVCY